MKTPIIILLFLFVLISCQQGEARNKSVFCNAGPVFNSRSAQHSNSLTVGLNSFSFQSGLEHHLSVRRNLQFNLQYSCFYLVNKNPNAVQKAVGHEWGLGLQGNADIRIKERHHLKAGLGLRQSIVQSSGSLPGSESNTFSMDALPKSGFNPYLMTAYQKELRLFHQRLSCSIEYNLGFFPFTQQLQTLSSASRYNQGLFVGLRYSF